MRSSIPCATCRTALSGVAGDPALVCAACGGVTLTNIKCLGCGVSLACSAKSPAISCSLCSTVTMIQDRQAKCIAHPAQCTQCFSQLLVPATQQNVKCPKCHVIVSAKRSAPSAPLSAATATQAAYMSSSGIAGASAYSSQTGAALTSYGGGAAAAAGGGGVEMQHLMLDPPENTSFGFTTAKYSITEQPEVEPTAPPVCTFTDGGLPVTYVMDFGVAQRAGMQPGDVIVRVNGIDVTSFRATQVVETIRTAARPVRVDVLRRNAPTQAAGGAAAANGTNRPSSAKTNFFTRIGEGFKTLTRGAGGPEQGTASQSGRTHVLRDGRGSQRLSAADEERMANSLSAVTGMELVQAYDLLERCDWNLQRAIDVHALQGGPIRPVPSQSSIPQYGAPGSSSPSSIPPSVMANASAPMQLPSYRMHPAAAPHIPSVQAPAAASREQMIDQVSSVLGLDRGMAEALLCDSNWRVETAIDRGLELPRLSPKPADGPRAQQQQQQQSLFVAGPATQQQPQQQSLFVAHPPASSQSSSSSSALYPQLADHQPAAPPVLPAWMSDPSRAGLAPQYPQQQQLFNLSQSSSQQSSQIPLVGPAAAATSSSSEPQVVYPASSSAAAPGGGGEWKDVSTWLAAIGMSQYERIFVEQELLDPTSICELTEEDLKELGFTLIGAKKKMMAAINRLRAAHNLEPPQN